MLMTFIRALPFLIPFLKELTSPDKEGKHQLCTRILFSLLMVAGFFYLLGKPMLNEWVELESENRVLVKTIEEYKRRIEVAEKDEEEQRQLANREHQELNQMRQLYEQLHRDHYKLENDYRHLNGQYRELVGKVEAYQRGFAGGRLGAPPFESNQPINQTSEQPKE